MAPAQPQYQNVILQPVGPTPHWTSPTGSAHLVTQNVQYSVMTGYQGQMVPVAPQVVQPVQILPAQPNCAVRSTEFLWSGHQTLAVLAPNFQPHTAMLSASQQFQQSSSIHATVPQIISTQTAASTTRTTSVASSTTSVPSTVVERSAQPSTVKIEEIVEPPKKADDGTDDGGDLSHLGAAAPSGNSKSSQMLMPQITSSTTPSKVSSAK